MRKNKELKEEKKEFEIPVEGSLGLLALGYRGVVAWRKVRNEAWHKERKSRDKNSE